MTPSAPFPRLTEWQATALSGNNMLSAVFYAAGFSAAVGGTMAPILLLVVVGLLAAFRSVFLEIVGLFPASGGAYQALLNATSKPIAAIAGALALLSCLATAAVSVRTAVAMAGDGFGFSFSNADGLIFGGVLMAATACIVALGVRDAARAASGLFGLHVVTLTAIGGLGLLAAASGDAPALALNEAWTLARAGGLSSVATLWLPAFGISVLAISGLESASGYVEQLPRGGLGPLLRNLLLGCAIFTPLLAALLLRFFPTEYLAQHPEASVLGLARILGGDGFAMFVAIDAVLVLLGATLASFVGAADLVRRMSLDRVLPSLLRRGVRFPASARAVTAVAAVAFAMLLATGGHLPPLASAYAMSFLGTIGLLATALLVLRHTRPEMPRPFRASPVAIFAALGGSALGFIGAVLLDPEALLPFAAFLFPILAFSAAVMMKRDLIHALLPILTPLPILGAWAQRKWQQAIDDEVFIFVREHGRLWSILDYLRKNEGTWKIALVHFNAESDTNARKLDELLGGLKAAGFLPHLQHRIVHWPEPFHPESVARFRAQHGADPSRIFMGSIHHGHPFAYEDFGGVRIIF